MGYTQNEFIGEKYEQGQDVAVIAKKLRADIKEAVKAKKLPKGKYSVRIERFAGGCACRVTAKDLPFNPWSEEYLDCIQPDGTLKNWPPHGLAKRNSTQAAVVLEILNSMLSAYRYDDSDGMIDYFDTNFYGNAEFDYQWAKAWEKRRQEQKQGQNMMKELGL